MICFSLNCANGHNFEGWFRDGATYERQAHDGDVSCPTCGDRAVRKALMAPAVVRSALREVTPSPPAAAPVPTPPADQVKAAFAVAMLRQLRAHVEANFENVGDRFPEEVRRIHYGETEEREIYGQASLEDAKELVEEGIPIRPLPDVPELDG